MCPFCFLTLFITLCSDGQEEPPSWVCLSGQFPLGYSHPACSQKAFTAWTLTPSARPPLTLLRLCLHMTADPPSQQNFSNWRALNPATHTRDAWSSSTWVPHPVTAEPNCADALVIVVRLQAFPGCPLSTHAPPLLFGP